MNDTPISTEQLKLLWNELVLAADTGDYTEHELPARQRFRNALDALLAERDALRGNGERVLVPREPTEEMLYAGVEFMTITPGSATRKAAGNVYEAMVECALAAADGDEK